jgi:FKBP-type peptidyl-prolyl cis-trans isomerase
MKFEIKTPVIALIGVALLQPGCAHVDRAAQAPPAAAAAAAKPAPAAITNAVTTNTEWTNAKDKASYAIGMEWGRRIKRSDVEVNLDEVINGLKDVLAGHPAKMTDQQVRETITSYQRARQRELAERNLRQGEAFLAENKKKEGVKTHAVALPDGKIAELQYKIITEGTGDIPGSNDVVTVNYRGTLINGMEFDSSAGHGKAATFPVRNVIRGWSEALQMMKVGSKWELYLPASLGYGDRGMLPRIEPGTTLIFEVELLSIGPQKPSTRARPPTTSDIIRVPSADEMKAGAKIEVVKPEDLEKNTAGQTNGSKTDLK